MDGKSEGVRNPAAHRPGEAGLEELASVEVRREAMAWAVTGDRAERRNKTEPLASQAPKPIALNARLLIRGGRALPCPHKGAETR